MIVVKKFLLNLMALCMVTISISLLFSTTQANAKTLSMNSLENLNELSLGRGYALFYIDTEIDSASFELQLLSTKKVGPQSRHTKSWKYNGKSIDVSLSGLAPGFYVLPIKEGVYQIIKVRAPYFDLPYWLDTRKDIRWQFNVKKDQLNYVGHLDINKERGKNYISVALYNRIAMDIQAIQTIVEDVPISYPLRMGAGVKDDFLSLANKEIN